MRQIRKIEEIRIKNNQLKSLFVSIFNDNLEHYVFPNLKLKWKIEKNETNYEKSSIYLIDESIIYHIQNYNHHANVFILLPEPQSPYMPSKKMLLNSLHKLNMKDQEIWFNEWYFLPEYAQDLEVKITHWFNEEIPMKEIKDRTQQLTMLNDKEVKDLLVSHKNLAGTNYLRELYPD